MAGRIQNLEIFAAGTWKPGSGGKITITEADLDEMVQSFAELQGSNLVKPHLKLGHQESQKWFGQKTGVPSLGWVERVWRQGSKLFADIGSVPEALLDMIKNGRYHNVSVEVFPKGAIKLGDKAMGQVLSAVALLGTEMPAVKSLAGLADALFSTEMQPAAFGDGITPITFSSPTERGMFTQEQVDSLIAAEVAKTKAAVTAEFSAKVEGLEAQIPVLTARAEGAEKQVTELVDKAAFSDAEKLVDDAIKAGKLLPKQKEMAMAFATQKTPIKFGGAEKSQATLFSEFIGELKPQVDVKERGASDGKDKEQFSTAAAEVDSKVQEYIAKNGGASKVNYADAMAVIFTADPELKTRYSEAQQ